MSTLNALTTTVQSAAPTSPAQQFAALLSTLSDLKAAGKACMTQYILPGRKEMMRILGCVFDEHVNIMQSPNRTETYSRLRGRLKADGINMHADTPNSGVLLRMVFPSLDASRLSKYARAIEAAYANSVKAGGFAAFVEAVGGIDKIRMEMKPVFTIDTTPPSADLRYAKGATSSATPLGLPSSVAEYSDDALEFGDGLWEVLQSRKAQPLLSLNPTSTADLSVLEQSLDGKIVLIAEIRGGQLHVLEQVPFVEHSIVSALQTRYPTCAQFVAASNKNNAQALPATGVQTIVEDASASVVVPVTEAAVA